MAPPMPALADLNARISTPSRLLQAPGPTAAQLAQMLDAAMHVPDHGRLAPWRFLHISGEARLALGEILASQFGEPDLDASAVALEKKRLRLPCPPCISPFIAHPVPATKFPELDHIFSGGETGKRPL